jgi:UDP-3-O-[3-hydroxymyristoyl] glucosamine N-acyltransferase
MDAAPGIGDARFFRRTGPHSLARIAAEAGVPEPADPARLIDGVAPLQNARPGELSFLDNRRYAAALAATRAGAVIVHPEMASRVPEGTVALVTREPYLAWARVCALFHPLPPMQPGIHPSAVVDPAATIDPTAEIGPFAVIGPGVTIGPRTRIAPFVLVAQGVEIGADCRIGAHAVVSHTLLGDRVVLYPGVKTGQDGFGFATTSTGHVSVPQLGRVILHHDVEVGANTTIDRGSAHDTVIGAGTRIDNLVQIGHNVRTGRCCVIVALAGISGSSVLEDFVVVAGQAGIAGHLHIGKAARIGAQAGVMGNVAPGTEMLGSPAFPAKDFFRQVATLKRLATRPAPPHPAGGPAGKTESD